MRTPRFLIISFTLSICCVHARAADRPSISNDEDQQTYSADITMATKVVIIPDSDHGNPEMLDGEIDALRQAKLFDTHFDCLFLEIEPKASLAIENFQKGQPYADSVQKWIKQSSERIGESFLNIIPENYLRIVAALNYRIVGVDVDWSSPLGSKIIPEIKIKSTTTDSVELEKTKPLIVGERSEVPPI